MEENAKLDDAVRETANLPDLPSLESVRTTDFSAAVFLIPALYLMWIVPSIIYAYVRYREFIDTRGTAVVGVVMALLAWVVIRLLAGFYSFSADSSGLMMRAALRRRLIRWTEVRQLSIRTTRLGTTFVELELSGGERVRFDPRGLGVSRDSSTPLVASIWQHLRQIGRADGVALPESVIRLWKPVWDDVPAEIEWRKPPHRLAKIGRGLVVIMFLSTLVWVPWGFADKGLAGVLFVAPIMAMCLACLKIVRAEMMLRAWRVSVREDCLETESPGGRLHLPWSEIVSARWFNQYLRIRADSPRREVSIPFATGNRESEDLVLAIVRQLREDGGVAVALPVCVSREAEALIGRALSPRGEEAVRRAYLNTLPEPVRRRLQRLYPLPVVGFFLGMVAGGALAFSDVLGVVSRWLYVRPGSGTVHLVPQDSASIGVPWMFAGMAAGCWLGYLVCLRLAGTNRDEWRRLVSIGASPQLLTGVVWVCAVIVIATVIATPLGIDCYARVTEQGFAINDYFSFHERFYPWSRVRGVRTEPKVYVDHGVTKSRNTYVVQFADGSDWRRDEEAPTERQRDDIRRAMDCVAAHAAYSAPAK